MPECLFAKRKAWRQLKKDRPRFFLEAGGGLIESFQWLTWIFQPFDVGYIFVRFYCPEKTVRCPEPPVLKSLGFGKPIKGSIELNRIKVLNIVFQPL